VLEQIERAGLINIPRDIKSELKVVKKLRQTTRIPQENVHELVGLITQLPFGSAA
jgi:hypothetical protein